MRTIRIPLLGLRVALFARDQGILTFETALTGKVIRGPHSPAVNGRRELGLGRLSRKEFQREFALVSPEGAVLSRKVITDTGVTFLRNDWFDNSKDISNMNAHANGTNTTAEAAADTALGTEVETRVSGTKSQVSTNQLRTIGTISITGTRAVTEHGIFDSTTTSGSTLWDRSVFTVINVVNGDSIQYTYTCTISSGG